MSKVRKTQEEVVLIVKDYVKTGDPASVVARRNGVSYSALRGWLKRLGIKSSRGSFNWDRIKEQVFA